MSVGAAPLPHILLTAIRTAPPGAGFRVGEDRVTFVPHALPIMEIGLVLGLLAIVCWLELRKCTCRDKSTFLRPRWRRYDRKDKP